jgi:ATP-binding cassette, subfamily B, bacterial PglK
MIKLAKNILLFLDKKQKLQTMFLISLMLIAALTELIGLSLILLLLNIFLGINNTLETGFLLSYFSNISSDSNFNKILIVFFVIFSIKFFIQIFVTWNTSSFIAKFREKTSLILYNNFLRRDPKNLLSKNSSEYLRNFTEEISQVVLFYQSIINIILDFIIFITFVFFMMSYNPQVSTVIIFSFTLIGLSYFFTIKNKLTKWARQSIQNRKKKIQFVNESFSAIKYIKIFSSENFFLNKFKIENNSLSKISFKYSFLSGIPRYVFEYILFLSILALLFFLLNQQLPNEKLLQMLGIYTLVTFRIMPIINKILISAQHIRFTQPSFMKVFIEQKKPTLIKNTHFKNFSFQKNLKINIKRFNHENKTNFSLKNIKLNIDRKSKVGIIGPSGSGKSTIIDIICGFQNMKNGKVLVDGKNIFSNLDGWQSKIGYIPQDVVILNQSLRDNILFGSSPKKYSELMIKNIIKKVKLEKFLKKLPKGLSQVIKQNGDNISGGEKQRIGIARALLHNPDLVLLDEATSGLDSFTELKVLETIKNLNKTVIIVSHRINSLKFCDKVYSIKNSTIKTAKI